MELAFVQMGKPLVDPGSMGAILEAADFIEIEHHTVDIRFGEQGGASEVQYVPGVSNYANDEAMQRKEVANGFRLAMGQKEYRPWSGFLMELFTRYRGYTPAMVELMEDRLCAAVNRRGSPFYFVV